MSLDISIIVNVAGEDCTIASTNWLRNPFGLCQVIEDNVVEVHPEMSLYEVINRYAYGMNRPVDRKQFQRIVNWYVDKFCALEKIVFHIPSLKSFETHFKNLQAEPSQFPMKMEIEVAKTYFGGGLGNSSIYSYKEWAMELKRMAKLLQDRKTDLYVSN